MSTETPTIPLEAFRNWLSTGERGLSSETIAEHLSGFPIKGRHSRGVDHPHDPSDFRRCERLLRAVPEARAAFGHMRTASPTWARLVDAWDDLVALSEIEAPGMIDDPNPHGSLPLLFQRLNGLLYPNQASS